MNHLDGRMAKLCAAQFGVISWAQLRSLGMSERMIERRVARGALRRLNRGVYLLAGVSITWEARLLAAQMWLGDHAVVSHRSAASLWKLDGYPHDWTELTLTRGTRVSQNGVTIHCSKLLDPRDIRRRGPFRVTGVERTLADLGSAVSERRVEEALDSALFNRLTTFARVRERTAELRRRGVRGAWVLDDLLTERDPERAPGESVFETRFWRLLKASRLPEPVTQYMVFDDRGFVARLDLAYPAKRVGVEAYSLRWHSPRQRLRRDTARHNRLTTLGWRILYETFDDLNQRPTEILDRLDALLAM